MSEQKETAKDALMKTVNPIYVESTEQYVTFLRCCKCHRELLHISLPRDAKKDPKDFIFFHSEKCGTSMCSACYSKTIAEIESYTESICCNESSMKLAKETIQPIVAVDGLYIWH